MSHRCDKFILFNQSSSQGQGSERNDFCYRGLEHKETSAYVDSRAHRKQAANDIVMIFQEGGEDGADELAEQYAIRTRHAQWEALQRGREDAKVARRIRVAPQDISPTIPRRSSHKDEDMGAE